MLNITNGTRVVNSASPDQNFGKKSASLQIIKSSIQKSKNIPFSTKTLGREGISKLSTLIPIEKNVNNKCHRRADIC